MRRQFDKNESSVKEEIYWISGVIFIFEDSKKFETLLKLEMKEKSVNNKEKCDTPMELTIRTNVKEPNAIFESIHLCIKNFIEQWVVLGVSKNINVKITKNVSLDQSIETTEKINVGVKKIERNPMHSGNIFFEESPKKVLTANCLGCGFMISINEATTNCDICYEKDVVFEKQFGMICGISQGGFGRVFKAFHIGSEHTVAIKERLNEKEEFLKSWTKEIKVLELLKEKVKKI